jgi:hypothetical protein
VTSKREFQSKLLFASGPDEVFPLVIRRTVT